MYIALHASDVMHYQAKHSFSKNCIAHKKSEQECLKKLLGKLYLYFWNGVTPLT